MAYCFGPPVWDNRGTMYYSDLGYNSYEDYRRGAHWQRITRKRHGKTCQRRFCGKPAMLTHHLRYTHLGREKNNDLVYLCFDCNDLAHFYDTGKRIPVTEYGGDLQLRWKEINSLWWNIKRFRPSYFFTWVHNSYSVSPRRAV